MASLFKFGHGIVIANYIIDKVFAVLRELVIVIGWDTGWVNDDITGTSGYRPLVSAVISHNTG